MKYSLIIAISIIASVRVCAQQTPQEELAAKIAGKMKDSLGLSTAVHDQIYVINLQLHQQKMAVRSQYANVPDSLRINIQRVENKRDSLYRAVMQSDAKWILYRQKKVNLISSN